ncbi:MAG: hypothetical protein RQ757_06080 [Pseudomonadales bacterium]|nr:hypothetical protein [Pseudomonadales bacterium]
MTYTLPLRRRKLVLLLSLCSIILLGIHSGLTLYHYLVDELPWLLRQLFDVDEENNIPTWYSSIALFLAALLLLLLASEKKATRDPFSIYWLGLSAGFLLLSLDEMAGLHESLNSVTESSWAVYGAGLVIIVAIAYLRFLYHLPTRTAVQFILSGAVFLGGAIGVELYTEPYLYNDALDTLAYNLWTPVEEGMEMFGVILFINALLTYMHTDAGTTISTQINP